MEINDYQKRAMATLNPELAWKDVLLNSVMGLCGESGEAIDIVKKWLSQGHALDRAHLAEAATALEIPLEEILQSNLDKLQKRYPDGFDAQKSIDRAENGQ